MNIERHMFPPRAESTDSISLQPAIGQPDGQTVLGDSSKPAKHPSNFIEFSDRRTHDAGAPGPLGAPVPDDYFTHLFSMSFFKHPFVTMPQEPGDDWGEFWERVVMWNDEPTDNACADCHRGRKYGRQL